MVTSGMTSSSGASLKSDAFTSPNSSAKGPMFFTTFSFAYAGRPMHVSTPVTKIVDHAAAAATQKGRYESMRKSWVRKGPRIPPMESAMEPKASVCAALSLVAKSER